MSKNENKIDWGAPTVAPVVGKRGRMRNGDVTGLIKGDQYFKAYPFQDDKCCWTANGGCFVYHDDPRDIIAIVEDQSVPIEIQLEDCSDEVLEMLHKSGQLPEGRYDEEKYRRSGK